MLLTRKVSVKFESFDTDNVSETSQNSFGTARSSAIRKKNQLPVEKLITFLTENFDSIPVSTEKLLEFEHLTNFILGKYRDSELYRVLHDQGWTGSRFRTSDDVTVDCSSCLQALSNLYLKQKYTSYYSTMIGDPIYALMNDKEDDVVGLRQLSSFCPDIILDYLQNNTDPINPDQARSLTFTGACMLADISGFSKFAGAMCENGVGGLDELREATNGFLGHFVQVVYEYNGDVIEFAGDALLCIFPDSKIGTTDDLINTEIDPNISYGQFSQASNRFEYNPCFRALQCACVLKSHTSANLSTHLAVSYGEMKIALFGGLNNQCAYVMNGECVSALASCIHDAGPQEVVVTEECYYLAEDYIERLINAGDTEAFINAYSIDPTATTTKNILVDSICTSLLPVTSFINEEYVDEDTEIDDQIVEENNDEIIGDKESYENVDEVEQDSQNHLESDPEVIYERESGQLDNIEDGEAVVDETEENYASQEDGDGVEETEFDYQPEEGNIINQEDDNVDNNDENSTNAEEDTAKFEGLNRFKLERKRIKNGSEVSSLSGRFTPAPTQPVNYPQVLDSARVAVNISQKSLSSQYKSSSELVASHHIKRYPFAPRRSNNVETVQSLTKLVMPYVPRPVLNAINSKSLDQIGELRVVTTMFLSLDTYSTTLHRDPTTLQPFFLLAQSILTQSGGFLRQFLVDDKGCVFIAMWGTPSFTYANNCSRALFCAVAIHQQAMSQLMHQCSIGVTTGNVFCGCVGAPQRRDYAGIGNVVNVAARLMSKASGRILIDESTYDNLNRKTKSMLNQVEQDMILRGMAYPIRPYYFASLLIPKLASVDETTTSSITIRRKVRLTLEDQLDKLSSNRRFGLTDQIVSYEKSVYFTVVLGLPGSGKSMAAKYFKYGARKRNIPCLFVQARPAFQGVPYGLIRKLFVALIGEDSFTTTEKQHRLVDNLIEQAYHGKSVDEKSKARKSLEILLGLKKRREQKKKRKSLSDIVEAKLRMVGSVSKLRSRRQLSKYSLNSFSYSMNAIDKVAKSSSSESQINDDLSAATAPNIIPSRSEDQENGSDVPVIPKKLNQKQLNPILSEEDYDDASSMSDLSIHEYTEDQLILDSPVHHVVRKADDQTFCTIFCALQKHTPTAIVIENAHYCDELSWHELHLLLRVSNLRLGVLITMRSNPNIKANSSSLSRVQSSNVKRFHSFNTSQIHTKRYRAEKRHYSFHHASEYQILPKSSIIIDPADPSSINHSLDSEDQFDAASDMPYKSPLITSRRKHRSNRKRLGKDHQRSGDTTSRSVNHDESMLSMITEDSSLNPSERSVTPPQSFYGNDSTAIRLASDSPTRKACHSGQLTAQALSVDVSERMEALEPFPSPLNCSNNIIPFSEVIYPPSPTNQNSTPDQSPLPSPSKDDILNLNIETDRLSRTTTGNDSPQLSPFKPSPKQRSSFSAIIAGLTGAKEKSKDYDNTPSTPKRSNSLSGLFGTVSLSPKKDESSKQVFDSSEHNETVVTNTEIIQTTPKAKRRSFSSFQYPHVGGGGEKHMESTEVDTWKSSSPSGSPSHPYRHSISGIFNFNAKSNNSIDLSTTPEKPNVVQSSASPMKSSMQFLFNGNNRSNENFDVFGQPKASSPSNSPGKNLPEKQVDTNTELKLKSPLSDIPKLNLHNSSSLNLSNNQHTGLPTQHKTLKHTTSSYSVASAITFSGIEYRDHDDTDLVSTVGESFPGSAANNTSQYKIPLTSRDTFRAAQPLTPSSAITIYLDVNEGSVHFSPHLCMSTPKKGRSATADMNSSSKSLSQQPEQVIPTKTSVVSFTESDGTELGNNFDSGRYGIRFENCKVIELAGLDEGEILSILYDTLDGEEIPMDLVRLVLDATSGNAYWVKAMASFIKERGISELEAAMKNTDSPLKVLILCRMEQLPLEHQLVLKYSSIIGDEFTDEMLESILPGYLRLNLAESIHSLTIHGFVLCIEEYPIKVYGFQNLLIQSTISELIPPSDAANIHLLTAQFIEAEYEYLPPLYPTLAHHYKHCIDRRYSAYKYALKAADHAVSRGAYNDGLIFALDAYDLAERETELKVLMTVLTVAINDLFETRSLAVANGRPSVTRRASGTAASGESANLHDIQPTRIDGYMMLLKRVETTLNEYIEEQKSVPPPPLVVKPVGLPPIEDVSNGSSSEEDIDRIAQSASHSPYSLERHNTPKSFKGLNPENSILGRKNSMNSMNSSKSSSTGNRIDYISHETKSAREITPSEQEAILELTPSYTKSRSSSFKKLHPDGGEKILLLPLIAFVDEKRIKEFDTTFDDHLVTVTNDPSHELNHPDDDNAAAQHESNNQYGCRCIIS